MTEPTYHRVDMTERDGHHPSCCGACDECLRVCRGYHGIERRAGLRDRRRTLPYTHGRVLDSRYPLFRIEAGR